MNQIIQTLTGNGSPLPQDFNTGTMRIHGDVIEFKTRDGKLSKVYRISNISSIIVFERQTPGVLIALTALALLSSVLVITIPLFLMLAASLFRYYYKTDQYRLVILLNAGSEASTYIASTDIAFLRSAAEAIRDAMNNSISGRDVYISVDQRKVNHVNIAGSVSGAKVVAGDSTRINGMEPELDETGS